jgi:hypothetical protein
MTASTFFGRVGGLVKGEDDQCLFGILQPVEAEAVGHGTVELLIEVAGNAVASGGARSAAVPARVKAHAFAGIPHAAVTGRDQEEPRLAR